MKPLTKIFDGVPTSVTKPPTAALIATEIEKAERKKNLLDDEISQFEPIRSLWKSYFKSIESFVGSFNWMSLNEKIEIGVKKEKTKIFLNATRRSTEDFRKEWSILKRQTYFCSMLKKTNRISLRLSDDEENVFFSKFSTSSMMAFAAGNIILVAAELLTQRLTNEVTLIKPAILLDNWENKFHRIERENQQEQPFHRWADVIENKQSEASMKLNVFHSLS